MALSQSDNNIERTTVLFRIYEESCVQNVHRNQAWALNRKCEICDDYMLISSQQRNVHSLAQSVLQAAAGITTAFVTVQFRRVSPWSSIPFASAGGFLEAMPLVHELGAPI